MILGLVPTRAGSVGIPSKNVKPFMGRPLTSYAIEVGLEVCDRVVLAYDDPLVCAMLAPWLREDRASVCWLPAEYATAAVQVPTVVAYVLDVDVPPVEDDDLVLVLQPTSPWRTPDQLRRAIDVLTTGQGYSSVVSVSQVPPTYHPDLVCAIDKDAGPVLRLWESAHAVGSPWPTGRNREPVYRRDGAVYAVRAPYAVTGDLYGPKPYPQVSEKVYAPLDEPQDWVFAVPAQAGLESRLQMVELTDRRGPHD